MQSYKTAGCASFDVEAVLAEELDPTGCARFKSEKLEVEACFQTKDRAAIGRARANQQVREPPAKSRGSAGRSKGYALFLIQTNDCCTFQTSSNGSRDVRQRRRRIGR